MGGRISAALNSAKMNAVYMRNGACARELKSSSSSTPTSSAAAAAAFDGPLPLSPFHPSLFYSAFDVSIKRERERERERAALGVFFSSRRRRYYRRKRERERGRIDYENKACTSAKTKPFTTLAWARRRGADDDIFPSAFARAFFCSRPALVWLLQWLCVCTFALVFAFYPASEFSLVRESIWMCVWV